MENLSQKKGEKTKNSSLQSDLNLTSICKCIEIGDCSPNKLRSFLSQVNLKDCKEFEMNQSPMVASVRADKNGKELLRLMIEEFGLNINSTVKDEGDGWCALAAAIVKEDEEMIRFLVQDLGADVNILKHQIYDPNSHFIRLNAYGCVGQYVYIDEVEEDHSYYLTSKKIAPNSERLLLHWTMDREMM